MKARISIASLSCLFVVLALVFEGCATTKKVDWDSRIGNFTYDQAVAELGPPDKQAPLTDGKIVADWVTRSSRGTSFGIGGGSYGHSGGVGVGVGTSSGYSDRVLRLTFGQDKNLVAWTKNY